MAKEYQGIRNVTSHKLKAKVVTEAEATDKLIDQQSKRYIEHINAQ